MKKLTGKKLIAAVALGTAFTFGGLTAAHVLAAAADGTEVAVKVNIKQGAAIDWNKDKDSAVTAIGIGPAANGSTGLARVAAITDAQRNLLGVIKGVQIDSDTLMEELIVKSDVVKRSINGLLSGANIIDEGTNADGSYYVKMSVPLYGASNSVAASALPEVVKNIAPQPLPTVNVKKSPLSKPEIKKTQTTNYTGVVVDAGGMGLTPTFSPVIYDTNGRAVYGIQNIDPDNAINDGMVGYTDTLGAATSGSRAGANPLVIKAVDTTGGKNSVNKVNVVVSPEDADRILLANEKSKMLSNCAVVFVR